MRTKSFQSFRHSLVFALVLLLSPDLCRAQASLPAPTAGEQRVKDSLNQVVQLELHEKPLEEVVEELKQRHHLQVWLDRQALEDAGLDDDVQIFFGGRGITLRSALRLALDEFDLTCLVRDGYLLITSNSEAENIEEGRVYPVGDLVSNFGEFTPITDDGSKIDDERANYGALCSLIKSVVAPDLWGDVGGPSEIEVYLPSRAITFPQMLHVHAEAETLLSALRAIRDRQRAVAATEKFEFGRAHDNAQDLKIKSYQIGGGTWRRGGVRSGGGPLGKEMEQSLSILAKLIPEIIEPESWQSAGGKGVIRELEGAIIVHQTEAVHRAIDRFLADFAPMWRAKTKLVPPRLAPQPDWPRSPEPRPCGGEAAVEKALHGVVNLDFDGATLMDVVTWLRESQAIDARLDRRALDDAGVTLDAPVTFHATEMTLAQSLQLLLDAHELSFALRHESLLITSKVEAENMILTRIYPVFDLVAPSVQADQEELLRSSHYGSLEQIVRVNVQCVAWDNVGGPGVLGEYPPCGALVVRQTWQGHQCVERFLNGLREARSTGAPKETDE